MIYSFGSLNMDLVCQTPRLPLPGETLLGTQFQALPGGKGANQAIAAARLGGEVRLVGRVGADDFGYRLMASLKVAKVPTDLVMTDVTAHTGVASIVVDETGSNHIVVVPGANGQVDESDVQRLASLLQPQDIVLMQLEIPLPTVMAAAAIAQEVGARVILDPAPAPADLPDGLLERIDILTPNQVEASQLVGFPVVDVVTAWDAAQELRQCSRQTVIVKLGVAGVVVATEAGGFHQPAIAVHAIDTVAAGDAFNGGLAVSLAEGMALLDAVQLATAAAAYAVTQRGAQDAMPERSQANTLLSAIPSAVRLPLTG